MGYRICNQNIKYFNKFVLPCTWFIAKTWLNFPIDDFIQDYKVEKIKK